jgi:hypothetical protein
MKKFLITETQYRLLRKSLIENKLRSYVFDWDDNILRMSTKINMEKNENGKWVPLKVSTEEFAHLRTNPEYRLTSNSFFDFTDNKAFIVDTEKAIHHNSFAPSYKKFIEALVYANPFAINTARAHSPSTLKNGVKLFINMVLTPEEKSKMVSNIKKSLPKNLTIGLSPKQLVDIYLDDKGEYYPVSSQEFGERFGLDVKGGSANPEHAKKVAIENFVKKLIDGVKTHMIGGKYKKISLGFSDDDKRNVKAAEEFLENELSKMYPEVHFVIYDTSEGGNKKIVIEKQ